MLKVKVPAGLVSDEASLLCLHLAAFSLCPHMAFSYAHMILVYLPFLLRTPVLLNEAPTLKTYLTLITS